MLGMAAALVLGPWVAGAGAQSVLTPMEAQRQFLSTNAVLDVPVEMAYWLEDESIEWIYVVGWMTEPQVGGGSGTRMAVYRYNATDLDNDPKFAFYPPLNISLGTDQYKATGIVVDPDNGDVYICGEGTKSTGTTDYYVAKYKNDLAVYASTETGHWSSSGTQPENARTFDGGYADRPADIILAGTSTNKRAIVTGSSDTASNGDDFYTIAYDAIDGSLEWSERHDHASQGDDQPVEMAAWEIVGETTSDTPEGFYVAVAGTSYDSTTARDFMVVRYYVPNPTTPNTKKVGRYQPYGDDICTGIAPAKQPAAGGGAVRVAVSGSTTPDPTSPNDTAFVIATFNVELASWWNTTNSAVVWNPTENADIAVDVADSGGAFWATGNISLNADGDQHSVGIMAYLSGSGTPSLVGTEAFNFGESDGLDATAVNMFGVGTSAYIIGQHRDPNSDLVENYLVRKYDAINSLTALQLGAYGTYNGSTGMEHMGRAVGVYGSTRLFTTGSAGDPNTGIDWVTLRY